MERVHCPAGTSRRGLEVCWPGRLICFASQILGECVLPRCGLFAAPVFAMRACGELAPGLVAGVVHFFSFKDGAVATVHQVRTFSHRILAPQGLFNSKRATRLPTITCEARRRDGARALLAGPQRCDLRGGQDAMDLDSQALDPLDTKASHFLGLLNASRRPFHPVPS